MLPCVDDRPDRQAIYDYTALFFIPAPETFYVGIKSLQPGDLLEAEFDGHTVGWKTYSYHRWSIAPDPALTFDIAVDRADDLLTTAVRRQQESDVPLGVLLSGGIDSSLISAASRRAMNTGLRTFNVRFSDAAFDETWAAVETAKHIGSRHETLAMDDNQGTWDYVTALLLHAGQPFADTSFFAANAVCRLMRHHVTVALSGDGGDEGFGGYDVFWQIARIARWQRLPVEIWRHLPFVLGCLAGLGLVHKRFSQRAAQLTGADDTSIVEDLFCWVRSEEHNKLCWQTDVLPVRRLFEPKWERSFPPGASRIERLSAHTTEVNTRLVLSNDFLFKVDTASMKDSLEIRLPMLDEDLFAFGLTLSHDLKVGGQTCKRVLRAVAKRKLPAAVANKPKWGFGIPVDTWVDAEFKDCLRDTLLAPSSKLAEFLRPEAYRRIIEAFCDGRSLPDISRQGLYQRAIMLLSLQLALDRTPSLN
jgi:asparagine synthase (glutamine-hydrolysing)